MSNQPKTSSSAIDHGSARVGIVHHRHNAVDTFRAPYANLTMTAFQDRPLVVAPFEDGGGTSGSPSFPAFATPPYPTDHLHGGEVRLWFADVDAIAADASLALAYRRLMTPDERMREARLRFQRDRDVFLMTRALVRTTLSRFASVAPEDWRFEFNREGKPSVAACHGDARNLCFNVSHTRSLVVMALGRAGTLGVDVEMRSPQVDLGVAEHFFSERETAALRRLDASDRLERFVELWTLKESYVKARGKGLSMPLNGFSFDLDTPGRIGLSVEFGGDNVAEGWRFVQFEASPEHRVALCVERTELPLLLRLSRCVPLGGEWPAEWFITRQCADVVHSSIRN